MASLVALAVIVFGPDSAAGGEVEELGAIARSWDGSLVSVVRRFSCGVDVSSSAGILS